MLICDNQYIFPTALICDNQYHLFAIPLHFLSSKHTKIATYLSDISNDFMICVTHFAFENIAISKVHAAQDGGDQDGEGQGQVRSMMLCFNVFSQRLFN